MPKRAFQARVVESHAPTPSWLARLRAAALVSLPVLLLALVAGTNTVPDI